MNLHELRTTRDVALVTTATTVLTVIFCITAPQIWDTNFVYTAEVTRITFTGIWKEKNINRVGIPFYQFNPATCLCLSQARTWISIICRGLFCVQWVQLRREAIVCFVDIGGIDDHHCLKFLFINNVYNDQITQLVPLIRSLIIMT